MSAPRVVSLGEKSPAERAGVLVGDTLVSIAGRVPRDVIEYQVLADESEVAIRVRRGDVELDIEVVKHAGEPLGMEVSSAVFDRVRTCDNHCAFCFIHQLPKHMRRSLYMKDDDYRLSFLYGNFTTLTRFTELDLERVLTERLSPLFVSIHSTDPDLRARMLRNPRGATSLRWLRALLDGGIEVHGQIVVCPGVNDAAALESTMVGVLDEYPDLASVACVPLGVSRFNVEEGMRPHTASEASAVVDLVEGFQETFLSVTGRRMVHAADEYYLLARRPFPPKETYEGFPQHENGIGMARAFEAGFLGDASSAFGAQPGFFAWVDGAPPSGYRAPRAPTHEGSSLAHGPVSIITGHYGAAVLSPLLANYRDETVKVLGVSNDYFGGNIGVAGLLTGTDVARTLASEPADRRYLLPDACLSNSVFLDGMSLSDLPRHVEVIPSDGLSLARALRGLGGADSCQPSEPESVAGAR
ncbi:MAG: DUF512 domain-containing protein [Acidimicrobiales bacterium]